MIKTVPILTTKNNIKVIFIVLLFFLVSSIALFIIVDPYYYTPLEANLLFSFIFLVTFVHIAKRDYIFGLSYFFLYIYTIFTQIAYVVYPERLAVISANQYYGLNPYYEYLLFVGLSFIAIYIFFLLLYNMKRKKYPLFIFRKVRRKIPTIYQHLFLTITVVHNIIMLYFLVSNYGALNYYTQRILKDNKLFFYGFYFYEITLMVLYVKLTKFSNPFEKTLYSLILLLSGAIFLAISIRAGQRIEMMFFLLGFITYIFLSSPAKFSYKIKRILIFSPILILAFIIQNSIKLLRGTPSNPLEIVKLVFTSPTPFITNLLTSEVIIFQDYTGPSLLLLSSIHNHIIFPLEVIRSNFFNSLFFMGYPTLGSTLSRIVDPWGRQGHGYYFLSEGYNLVGWLGILYNGVIFTIGILLWNKFASSNNQVFNNYMTAIIAMHVCDIIRGQGCFFIKATYFSFMPAIILFFLASRIKMKLNTNVNIFSVLPT